MKWLDATVSNECDALERARLRFVEKPTEKRLHEMRTTGRRFRSLLEDVADLAPLDRLLRRVKRAAAATDAARDAAILLRLLESSVDPGEVGRAKPLLRELRKRERVATSRARKHLQRVRFSP
ncbi:MAG TPA: CHAD domain-containing protein [Candidatus Binatia bacterium]|nr:CHAD domain-containing protein [Candidatus Binatia bacterium]